jgi:membrane protease YdiL (CAAX protease family)
VITETVVQSPITRTAAARGRAAAESAGFVAHWMAIGFALGGNPVAYLLLGAPLTVAFQLAVVRRPLREMWVRTGPPFRLDRVASAIAGTLTILPSILLVQAIRTGDLTRAAWMVPALVGCPIAGYAVRQLHRSQLWPALRWIGIGTLIGFAFLVLSLIEVGLPRDGASSVLGLTGQMLVLYLPVVFVLEEVTFRGCLDSHLHHAGESRGWASALFVSAIWGLWHLPLASSVTVTTVLSVLVVHCSIGVALSFAWRRTGNLTVPGAAHAIIDAIRDGLRLG